MKREKNLHFLRMAVMIAIGVPAACMAVRAAEIPAAPAEDDMAFRMAGSPSRRSALTGNPNCHPVPLRSSVRKNLKGSKKISRTF